MMYLKRKLFPSRRILGYLLIITLTTLLAAAPGGALAANHQRALDAAVRISLILTWPDEPRMIDVYGSGWTRSCSPARQQFDVVVATAGHVLDVADIEKTDHQGERASTVMGILGYQDGSRFVVGRDDLYVGPCGDYGEIRFHSPSSRCVLPISATRELAPGAHLTVIASPGSTSFGTFEGQLVLVGVQTPFGISEAWLTTVPVAPGASGGPVLDDDGCVVATVTGYLEFPTGEKLSVLTPLPTPSQKKGRS